MPADANKPADGKPDRWLMHFEIQEKIGKGAFGTVWRAHDARLDRPVAIKIPRKERIAKSGGEIFLREARAAAQLKHPNIVPVFEVGRRGDVYYIVSDFIDGIGLDEWLRDQRPRHRDTATLIAKIADALEHAHKNGVVHRDLKPSNVLIDGQGEPHIMDFGLAKRRDDASPRDEQGRLIGTPLYMSPEQARGDADAIDARTDIYSLGVVFYEVLTGAPPFHGTVRILLDQIMYDDAPSPRRVDRSIPRDLETICLKCLQKNRMRRYQSCGEVAADLRRWLNHEPIAARPSTGWERRFRWAQRNRLSAGLLALLIGMTFVTIGWVAWQSRRTSNALAEAAVARTLAAQMERQLRDSETQAGKAIRGAAATDYASKFLLAREHWQLGDARTARKLLDACPAEARGWEHSWLARQMRAAVVNVPLPERPLDMAMSGRGVLAAVLCVQKTYIVDVVAGRVERDFLHGVVGPRAIAWHGAVASLAIANASGVTLIDANNGRAIGSLPIGQGAVAVAANEDASLLAVASADDRLQLWNVGAREKLRDWSLGSRPRTVTVHPLEPMVAVGFGDGSAAVFVADATMPAQRETGHAGVVAGIDFLADGSLRWLVGNIVATRRRGSGPLDVAQLPATVPTAASLSANICRSNDNGEMDVWTRNDLTPLVKLAAHDGAIRRIAQLDGGKRVVTIGDDRALRVWTMPERPATIELKDRAVPGSLDEWVGFAFDDRGATLIAVGRTRGLAIRDGQSGQSRLGVAEEGGAPRAMAASHSGDQLALVSRDAGIRLLATAGGNAPAFLDTGRPAQAAAFSHSGKILAAATGKTIVVWRQGEDGRFAHSAELNGHEAEVLSVVFGSDENVLWSGDVAGQVLRWNFDHADRSFCEAKIQVAQAPILQLHLFAEDKLILAATRERVFAAAADGTSTANIVAESGSIVAAAIDDNGRRIATAHEDDLVRLWDAGSGQMIAALGPFPGSRAVAFSVAGVLAIGCRDGTLHLLNGRD